MPLRPLRILSHPSVQKPRNGEEYGHKKMLTSNLNRGILQYHANPYKKLVN